MTDLVFRFNSFQLSQFLEERFPSDAPKKGLLLDGTAKLTCEQMARAMKRVQDGSMPPKGSLTGEERGDVFQELLDLVETK